MPISDILIFMFNNIKINIIELLSLKTYIKNEKEIEFYENKINQDGFIVVGNYQQTYANLPRIFYQYMSSLQCYDNTYHKNVDIPVLKLDVPNQYIGLMIEHSLNDLFKILIECEKYNLSNTKYIELMILDNIDNNFAYKNTYYNSKICYDTDFVPVNKIVFEKRIFGAGNNYDKVKDLDTRNELILIDGLNHNYPDQNHNNNNYNSYEYPLLFYIKKCFPLSKLESSDSLNIYNLNNIIDILTQIQKSYLITKIIDKFMFSPETSNIIYYKKYRKYASPNILKLAFNHQLIKEQMISVFKKSEWSQHNIQLWTLDDLEEETFESMSFIDYQLFDCCYNNDEHFNYNINTINPGLIYNEKLSFKVPTNKEACYNFHKIFTKGLLDFSDKQINEFYSDNLIIGGSVFAFCACGHPYYKENNVSNEYFEKYYNNSDVDCPIMAGDDNYLSTEELSKIVDEKILILQKYYPGGWKFEKKLVEKRFQITNNYNSTVLEMFSVPYSKNTVWKHFAKYHFAWVRGYFDGFKWYILPSALYAVYKHVSIDIRYCSTKHAPHELIYKYLQRGFIPILNNYEIKSLNNYINNKQLELANYYYQYHSHTNYQSAYYNSLYYNILNNVVVNN